MLRQVKPPSHPHSHLNKRIREVKLLKRRICCYGLVRGKSDLAMACVAGSSLLKAPLSCSKLAQLQPLSSISVESRKFGLHLSPISALTAAPSKPDSLPFLSSSSFHRPVFVRLGGRYSDNDKKIDYSSMRSENVRLIDENQNMVGVVSKSLARQMADEAQLDLVVVSADANPPVVKIIDYDKYRYEQQKKKREQHKKSAASRMDLKELKMGYNIDIHDYTVRLKAAKKFLQDGDKVKVFVNLKGRENEFRRTAIDLIKRFQNDIGELATLEAKNFKDKNIFMVLVPSKAILQKGQESPQSNDNSPANESPQSNDNSPADESPQSNNSPADESPQSNNSPADESPQSNNSPADESPQSNDNSPADESPQSNDNSLADESPQSNDNSPAGEVSPRM